MGNFKKQWFGICLLGFLITYLTAAVQGKLLTFTMTFETGTGGGRNNTFSMYYPNNKNEGYDQTFPDLGMCNGSMRIPVELRVLPYPIQIQYEAHFYQGGASNLGENPWFKISRIDRSQKVLQTMVNYISYVTDNNAHVTGTFTIPAYEGADIIIKTGSWRLGSIFYTDYGYGCWYKITYRTDTVAPPAPAGITVSGATTINGETFTKVFPVSLSWNTVTDLGNPVSGIKQYIIQYNNQSRIATINSWTDVNVVSQISYLYPSDDKYSVLISASDIAGNNGSYSNSYVFTLDTTPPSGTLTINNSSSGYTKTNMVALSLSNITDGLKGSGVSEVCFSNDGIDYTDWEPCTGNMEKEWTLSSGDGSKTVYMKLKDRLGNITPSSSPIYTTAISLDTTPPENCSIAINGTDTIAYQRGVMLTLAATDAASGVASMQFSNDGINFSDPEIYTTSKSWLLTTGTGTKTVYAKFTDRAGNTTTSIISGTITLENSSAGNDLGSGDIRTLTDDETWSQSCTIIGQVIVPVGKTLTISNDVQVTFIVPTGVNPYQGGLIVHGTLNVGSGVIFTTTEEGWMGIIIDGAAGINGATFNKARRGLVILSGSDVTAGNCIFSNNIAGIHVYNSDPAITNCVFESNTYGIKEDSGAAPVVIGCGFSGNKVDYYHATMTRITMDQLNAISGNSGNHLD